MSIGESQGWEKDQTISYFYFHEDHANLRQFAKYLEKHHGVAHAVLWLRIIVPVVDPYENKVMFRKKQELTSQFPGPPRSGIGEIIGGETRHGGQHPP